MLKSYRPEQLAPGWQVARVVLTHRPERAACVFLEKQSQHAQIKWLESTCRQHKIELQRVERKVLDEAFSEHTSVHQGVVVALRPSEDCHPADCHPREGGDPGSSTIIALDCIQDPHNFGAALRTAYAMKADAVLVTQDRSSPITPTVHKVSQGASVLIPIIQVKNLARSLEQLKQEGFWCVGTDGEGTEMLGQFKFPKKTVLIMGNEHEGMRKLTKTLCDHLIQIPMAPGIDSLNVSVALGMCLFERMRTL